MTDAKKAPAEKPATAMDAGDFAPLKLFKVQLDRDPHTRIPATVLGYEVPVMVEIYGEENVLMLEEHDFDATDFDVEAAYDNLRNKYRKFEPQLKAVYRSLGTFAKALGVKAPASVTATKDRDRQASVKVHAPAKG